MKHILFGSNCDDLRVAILIKSTALNKTKLRRYYIDPLKTLRGANFVAYDLAYNDKGKAPAALIKECLTEVLQEVNDQAINTILVCDAPYFKTLTKNRKADGFYGYTCPCAVKGYEHINIILCPNHQALMYNPALQDKIDRALECMETHIAGTYIMPGTGIIKSAYYPETIEDIQRTLDALHKFPELTCDIEGQSLEFWNCNISSIAFAWDQHNGVAFGVDRGPGSILPPKMVVTGDLGDTRHQVYTFRPKPEQKVIREYLIRFFETYQGKLIYHNISFDAKVLTYELFMAHLADYEGMIEGIKVLTKNFDDTKVIAYMATNNAVKNELGLKPLSGEFTGNYAEDVTDTNKIPLPDLLKYNLTDCLATWYVKNKYEPIMDADQQRSTYENLMKETVITLLQTELCGMPIIPEKVQAAKTELQKIVDECNIFFSGSEIIKTFHMGEMIMKADIKTKDAKAKAKTNRATKTYRYSDSVIWDEFNPNSNTQISKLLYDYLGYPILDLTKSKAPSTGKKTLEKLKELVKIQLADPNSMSIYRDEEHLEMFEQLVKLSDASIVLNTFIPAFENAQQLPDGSWRLYGNFNATGTQSLRPSSNSPNLLNIPSSSTFAGLIKECFAGQNGWLFVGSDFDAIEDKIGALLSKDPERLKIYTDGFCGHCVRALRYWPHKMPDIDPTSVTSVNSIKKKYKVHRQTSKAPSFALQYLGTFKTLMTNCGFSEIEAKAIEKNYHDLYKVSDEWIEDIIEGAKEDGYVTMAFGARLRTPLLARTIGTGRGTPYAAISEGRSAGNAATQSYCVLTLRAFNEFRQRIWDSPYRYDILPAATIYDAIYYLVKNSAEIMKWVNDNLIECMAWNGLPEIQHPIVKITSSLEVFWPSWNNAIELKNSAAKDEIKTVCKKGAKEWKDK